MVTSFYKLLLRPNLQSTPQIQRHAEHYGQTTAVRPLRGTRVAHTTGGTALAITLFLTVLVSEWVTLAVSSTALQREGISFPSVKGPLSFDLLPSPCWLPTGQ